MLVLITELIFTKYHYNEYKIEDQLYFLAHGGTQKRMCMLCIQPVSQKPFEFTMLFMSGDKRFTLDIHIFLQPDDYFLRNSVSVKKSWSSKIYNVILQTGVHIDM